MQFFVAYMCILQLFVIFYIPNSVQQRFLGKAIGSAHLVSLQGFLVKAFYLFEQCIYMLHPASRRNAVSLNSPAPRNAWEEFRFRYLKRQPIAKFIAVHFN
jgi:hypothetical protein